MADSFPGCEPMEAPGGGSLVSSRPSFPAATRKMARRYAEKEINFHWSSARMAQMWTLHQRLLILDWAV